MNAEQCSIPIPPPGSLSGGKNAPEGEASPLFKHGIYTRLREAIVRLREKGIGESEDGPGEWEMQAGRAARKYGVKIATRRLDGGRVRIFKVANIGGE